MSLASAIASASSRNGITHATGPKISSRTARSSGSTGASTVGGNQKPGPVRRAAARSPPARRRARRRRPSRAARRRSAGPSGSPRRAGRRRGCPRRRAASAARKSSSAGACTRMRERAQQSWPALPNTAHGAAAAAASHVGVGEHEVRRLAAQLQRDALDRLRRARGDPAADLGRAREGDLGHVGVLDEPRAAGGARPGDDVHDALGQARLDGDALELERGERRQLRRLEHRRVARRRGTARASTRRS